MITKYFVPHADIDKYILGKIFKLKKEDWKIYIIEKTWGLSRCYLAYVMAINDNAQRQRFLVKCKLNLYTKNADDKWVITIHEVN